MLLFKLFPTKEGRGLDIIGRVSHVLGVKVLEVANIKVASSLLPCSQSQVQGWLITVRCGVLLVLRVVSGEDRM